MEIKAIWKGKLQFEGITRDGHKIVMDSPYGKDTPTEGPSPMELLLVALAGCTGMDVVSILKKMKADFQRLEISVRGKRREEHPRYYEKVEIVYAIGGNVTIEEVKKAVELSLGKYCSVSNTLKPHAEIDYRIEKL